MDNLIGCIIIEDEPLAILHLTSLIKKTNKLILLGFLDDIEEIDTVQEKLKQAKILFLDLHISGGNIEKIGHYLKHIPYIIITSALPPSEYPIFIKNRKYFVLQKPIIKSKFNECLLRILSKNIIAIN
jgi:hypothetical protein